VMLDITDLKKKEAHIIASLKEKEILLKEIHHRVKNNMQVMSSLIKLQWGNTKDDSLRAMLLDSHNRIRAMALVHEKLYQSGDLSGVGLKEYVRGLTAALRRSYGPGKGNIHIRTTGDDIRLPIDKAIPCGLVINELVSNALKYAFPAEMGRGDMEVCLNGREEGVVEITVRDNGTGIPDEIDIHKAGTLGLQLVKMLVEDQLEGNLELDRSAGTEFRIVFRI